MIHTNAIIDGFPVILGSTPVQLGMLLAMLIAVRIPYAAACSTTEEPCPDEERELDSEAAFIYTLVALTHIFIIATKYLNLMVDKSWHMWNKLAIMLTLFLQLYTVNRVCGNWVFKNLGYQGEAGQGQTPRDAKFNAWLDIEFAVLMSYIVSAVIFLFIRCFAKDRWDLNFGNEITTENTDALEQKYVTMEVFQAFCAPAVATYVFFFHHVETGTNTIPSSVDNVLSAFLWMFVAQTAACVFINFITIYRLRHRGCPEEDLSAWRRFKESIRPVRNQVVPKL